MENNEYFDQNIKNFVKSHLDCELSLNQKWYIINANWWKSWKLYVYYDKPLSVIDYPHPGLIDNSQLLKNNEFNPHALHMYDYLFVPEEVWKKFKKVYGLVQQNDEVFMRNVIKEKDELIIETKLINLNISLFKDTNINKKIFTKQFSSKTLISEVKLSAANFFNIPTDKHFELIKHDKLSSCIDDRLTLADATLSYNQNLFIDFGQTKEFSCADSRTNVSIKGGASQLIASTNNFTTSGSFSNKKSDNYSLPLSKELNGVCGLANLGNTCFMNSAIQCVSNVPQLTKYFLDNSLWKQDLNRNNPLGMSGRIATSYASLIQEMWLGNTSYSVPRDFKCEVSKFAPQFNGYSQHDSQELLMFLLDGLHEDLNRIINKPYVELENCSQQPDKKIADTNWQYHLSRNDSIIVDNFHGQLKSRVVCPDCQFVSVTFDPFACLSLPISQPIVINILVIYRNTKISPASCQLTVYRNCLVETIKKLILKELTFQTDSFIKMVQLKSSGEIINANLDDKDSLFHLNIDDQLVFYELPAEQPDNVYIDVTFKVDGQRLSSHKYPLFMQVSCNLNWYSLLQGLQSIEHRFLENIEHRFEASGDELMPCQNDQKDHTNVPNASVSTNSSSSSLDQSCNVPNNTTSASNSITSSGSSVAINNPYQDIFNIFLVQHSNQHEITPLSRTRSLQPLKQHLVLDWTQESFNKYFKSSNYHPTTHLSIPASTNLIQTSVCIEDCLSQFLSEECLGSKDLWHCPKCRQNKAASKKLDIWRLPRVLVVHFKRFKAQSSFLNDKINTQINYAIRGLDLSDYIVGELDNFSKSDCIYDLVAVSNHVGSLGSGHYFCYAKNYINNKWYKFDDSTTTELTDENKVISKNAYVLIYVSRTSNNRNHNLPITNGIDCHYSINNESTTAESCRCNCHGCSSVLIKSQQPRCCNCQSNYSSTTHNNSINNNSTILMDIDSPE